MKTISEIKGSSFAASNGSGTIFLFTDDAMEKLVTNTELVNFGDRLWLHQDTTTEELYLAASG